MVKTEDFPLIISPNLGCPFIISIKELEEGKNIHLIIAARYNGTAVPLKEEFVNTLFLRPSYSEDVSVKDIQLDVEKGPVEISDWNLLLDFENVDESKKMINSEFHYKVLGENTRYWSIEAKVNLKGIGEYKTLLRQKGGNLLPTLYDLIYKDASKKLEKINYHSIQFVKDAKEGCNFIHLTDLHIAKRNDEMLDEVLKEKNGRDREEIIKTYINFNDNFRSFIKEANLMSERGELDFVIITGDMVDFAFYGWEDEINPDENNWKSFINIVTGRGKERVYGNIGIKVAIFTSTGNHDWRLHPYDPNFGDYNETFGLEKRELEHYKYKSFDSAEYPSDKRAQLSEEISSDAFKRLNLDAFTDKWKVRAATSINKAVGGWIMRGLPFLAIGGTGLTVKPELSQYSSYLNYLISILILGIAVIGAWGINKAVKYWVRKITDQLVDNPLHAEAKALHYYFKYVNPYLDYAFNYGGHSFIVMDTGADVFVGNLLDNKEVKHIKRMSLKDNILGGSPDSRAFDSEQLYYNWSQIVWLEKILNTVCKQPKAEGRTFIFLHSPPINLPDNDKIDLNQLKESNRIEDKKWISKEECYLTYGTVNHYLSQFFYLCTGYRESELVKKHVDCKLRLVDMVFSGHAHRNIEFRIEKDNNKEHDIRIFTDAYSQNFDTKRPYEWWGKRSPVILQTASCSVCGSEDKNPPYYRKVAINDKKEIIDFKVRESQTKK